jgi:DNA-binding NtrC family response regulator
MTSSVLLLSADIDGLQIREQQLRNAGFATRSAINANELQAAFDTDKIDVAVVGAALPAREKLRITTMLHDIAKRTCIVLLVDGEERIVDSPEAVLDAKAPVDEFVGVIKGVLARRGHDKREPAD